MMTIYPWGQGKGIALPNLTHDKDNSKLLIIFSFVIGTFCMGTYTVPNT